MMQRLNHNIYVRSKQRNAETLLEGLFVSYGNEMFKYVSLSSVPDAFTSRFKPMLSEQRHILARR